jgi:hypothetical protein
VTAPRVHATNAYYYRQSELDEPTLTHAINLIVNALSGGTHCTRKELELLLERGGISAPKGFRMAYILMQAELICSGIPNGKQQTYALLDERSPAAVRRQLTQDEALAELTRRYFTSHGPATAKDFRWWSSLTLNEIKAGLALAGDTLDHLEVDGLTYWFGEPAPKSPPPRPTVHLLQAYDEYLVGYSESKYALDQSGRARSVPQPNFVFNMVVVLDSQVVGRWRRTLTKDGLAIDVALHQALDVRQSRALQAAADAHAAFLGLAQSARLEVSIIKARTAFSGT